MVTSVSVTEKLGGHTYLQLQRTVIKLCMEVSVLRHLSFISVIVVEIETVMVQGCRHV